MKPASHTSDTSAARKAESIAASNSSREAKTLWEMILVAIPDCGGACEAFRAFDIGDHKDDLGRKRGLAAGIDQSLEIGAPARNEHGRAFAAGHPRFNHQSISALR